MFVTVLNMPLSWIFQASEYDRVLKTPGLRICEGLNMPRFWIYHGSKYASGSEYPKVSNIPGFEICQGYTGLWICLNMPDYAIVCGNMREYILICLNDFCFVFPHCNPLSKGTICWFLEERKFSLKYLICLFVLD